YPCRGGVDFFFIDSKDGNTYPCGYRGNENLGKFQDLDMNAVSSECTCTSCDWECFRDPSELFGPLTQAIYDPAGLTRKIFRERPFFSYWLSDLKYYFACDYFDGRRPLSREKLDKFSRNLFSPVFEEPGHGKTYGIPKNEIKEQRT
ncbi:MAG: hypothetical protein JXM72_04900, partial [Deltaproteobacteria bacterium]|nr:hypothetical protein [Deltaproteobacteria bacterium]